MAHASSASDCPASEAPDTGLLTLADWRAAYREGADPALLLEARVKRIAAGGPASVWIRRSSADEIAARCAELSALAAAHRSREALLARHPLFGVPFAVKDNIHVAGQPTTAACPAFAQVAAHDATVVQRLLDAGAVLVGKTNLDQFATGLVGTRSPYGAPSSVFDPGRVSGGSSSGSAVAVALGLVPFALGTDTAGSGRVPAALNHVVGLKPTPGRVSTAGVVPACRSLDCVAIFALSVDDAAAVLALVEGADPADPYSRFAPGALSIPPRPRIGVPAAPRLSADIAYPAAWQQALQDLERSGATIVPLEFDALHEVAALLYEGPWIAERAVAIEELLKTHPEAIDPVVRRVIGRAYAFDASDAFRGQYRLRELRRHAEALFDGVDLLVVPSVPTHPRHTDVRADPIGVNARLGEYTNFVNLLGWCALALPASRTAAGLPFGVTAIGRGGNDAALAAWGSSWQALRREPLGATGRAFDGGLRPAQDLASPATVPWRPLAVVGAHLSGLPLNGQLVERGAVLERATTTAPAYRLHALPGGPPARPGMHRVREGGAAIAVEVWRLPLPEWGLFVAGIPAPLSIGRVELIDGTSVSGFLCEAHALADAPDISHHGGWRAYLAAA